MINQQKDVMDAMSEVNEQPTAMIGGAGWYPDPKNADQKRFWDGSHWTELIHTTDEMPPPVVAPAGTVVPPAAPNPASGVTPPDSAAAAMTAAPGAVPNASAFPASVPNGSVAGYPPGSYQPLPYDPPQQTVARTGGFGSGKKVKQRKPKPIKTKEETRLGYVLRINRFTIVAVVFGLASLLLYPIVLGVIGVVSGFIGLVTGEPRAKTGIVIAILAPAIALTWAYLSSRFGLHL